MTAVKQGNPGARRLRSAGMLTAGAMLLVYIGIVAFLAISESSLVYVSAGEGRRGRPLPGVDVSIPWDTLRVRAADGVRVFLLVSRVDTSALRPWAIFFHGNAGMVGSRSSVERYALLRDAGFNVLAPEYRGYGAALSSGPASETGVYRTRAPRCRISPTRCTCPRVASSCMAGRWALVQPCDSARSSTSARW